MQISLINNKPPLKDKSVGGSNNNGVAAAESADGNRDAARRGVKVGGDKVSRSREEIHRSRPRYKARRPCRQATR